MLPGAWPQSRRVGGPVTPSNRDPTLVADFVNMATANGWRLVDTLQFALSKMMVPAMAGTPSGLRHNMSVSARLWHVEGQTDSPTSGPDECRWQGGFWPHHSGVPRSAPCRQRQPCLTFAVSSAVFDCVVLFHSSPGSVRFGKCGVSRKFYIDLLRLALFAKLVEGLLLIF